MRILNIGFCDMNVSGYSMNKLRYSKLIFISMLMVLCGCVTSPKATQDIGIGMSQQEIVRKAGKPFSKKAYRDSAGNSIEEWSYKETIWDDEC